MLIASNNRPNPPHSQLARRWRSNIASAFRGNSFWSLRADGMAAQTFSDINTPETTAMFTRSWRVLANGQVELATGRLRGTGAVCKVLPSDANCLVSTTRYWRFVARTGSRLFTIEQGPYFGPTSEADMSYRFVALSDLGELK